MLVTQVFNYTGAVQTFTVPTNVTSVLMECWGAPGGYVVYPARQPSGGYSGSTGPYATQPAGDVATVSRNADRPLPGYAAGELAVTAGQSFSIFVGGGGGIGTLPDYSGTPPTNSLVNNNGPGGYNGGAPGGQGRYHSGYAACIGGAGGGGATDVRSGGTALSNRILVAGGAGGAASPISSGAGPNTVTATANPTTPNPPYIPVVGSSDPSYYAVGGTNTGGPGGGTTANDGGPGTTTSGTYTATGGRGGSQTTGGAAGTNTEYGTANSNGTPGALGVGGQGSDQVLAVSPANIACGSGGGGGYYGGGGGAGSSGVTGSGGAGGGGGSNFLSSSFTSILNLGHVYNPVPNGQARFSYQQPPNAPTITSQAGGYVLDSQSNELDWSFSSLVSDAVQFGFDIRYQVVGAGSWTTISNPSSSAMSYVFASGTFTVGNNYNIEIRTYDQDGDVSPWAEITVSCVVPPTAPIITNPTSGSTITSSSFSVTWTIQSGKTQADFRVILTDASGNTVVDSGITASATPSFAVTGIASGDYSVSVTYSDTDNAAVFSRTVSASFIVNVNPPSPAVVSTTSDSTTGSVLLTITNPAGTYAADHNNIYRTNALTGVETKIGFAIAPNTNFRDYTVATRTPYTYRVRTYSAAGGFADVS